MNYDEIQNLLDRLSCDIVLASPEEPDSLSGLLPILKQLHNNCAKLSFNDQAKVILNLRKSIGSILENNPEENSKDMDSLNNSISRLIDSMSDLIFANQAVDIAEKNEDATDSEDLSELQQKIDKIEDLLKTFSKLIGEYCPDDLPDLGGMILVLYELIDASEGLETFKIFQKITQACLEYVENLTLENMKKTKPIEEGLILLKSVLLHIKTNEEFVFDYSDVLDLLSVHFKQQEIEKVPPPGDEAISNSSTIDQSEPTQVKISDDDIDIMVDFVGEAMENLDSIEVSLIDLEQDPSNKDIINDIFRPFHSIKGVSGFLSLKKINKLSHTTENLLDSARSGEFFINDMATDAILASVDTLKKLLTRVEESTRTGFLQPDNDINIDPLRDRLKKLQVSLAAGEKQPLGEILVEKGDISKQNLDHALEIQKETPDKKIGEILIDEKKAAPSQVASALIEQTTQKRKTNVQVKVSTDKLDDLVDYAGELVIAQSMLRQKTAHDALLTQSVSQLGQIVTNMQTIAMSMRMIPIKATFMKMIRLVRDLAKKSGKEIHLAMEGEDTEIDRNVVDAIYEPMVHMIRNSCDHGIESPNDRSAVSKPSHGNVTLRAYHKGGHIMIEIEDDGKGLDRDRILDKAIDTGLLSGNEQLSDPQIYDLILQPGFSTAKEITDVSGRGVGMDVVKAGIEKFRGQLSIESEKGRGTRFTISLPLTLAIIDGMLIRVDNEKYVIPTIAIQKAFKPEKDECFTVEGKGEMVKDRGNLIPVIRLNEIYNSGTERKVIWNNLIVVVESKEEKRALLIDELLGKDEFVIKSLGNKLEDVKGLAGGAILSDGRVGLILDIHGIFQIVND